MTDIELLFLKLICIAIGKDNSLHATNTEEQWWALQQMAVDQQMVGIIFHAIERLPGEERPPIRVIMRCHAQTDYTKTCNEKHLRVLAEFARLMDAKNIPYVVFKGQAVASLYHIEDNNGKDINLRYARTMGDIDFYVPPAEFDRAQQVIEKELDVSVEKDDVDKHYSFEWHEIHFEMHYQMETFGYSRHQKYFSELVDNCFTDKGKNKLTFFDAADDAIIPMLPPTIDIMMVFKHWFTHLLGEGVGLRQTTDIAFLINAYKDVINVDVLRRHLRNIGYQNGFSAMVALVERYYGIRWAEYQYTPSAAKYADRLMADLLKNGNLGRTSYKHKSGIRKRLETTSRFFRHCYRYFALARTDIVMSIPLRIAISLKAH